MTATSALTGGGVLRSEWIKWRTLRSSWLLTALASLAIIGIGITVGALTRHPSAATDAEDLAPTASLQGDDLALLLLGAVGVLFVSSEYSSGSVRSTFVAAPRRPLVLGAKVVVVTLVSLTASLVSCTLAFVAAQAIIATARPGYGIFRAETVRILLGTTYYLVAATLLGMFAAWLLRTATGALVTLVAVIYLLPALAGLAGRAGKTVAQYLPSQAAVAITRGRSQPYQLPAGAGAAVLAGWVVLGLASSGWLLQTRGI